MSGIEFYRLDFKNATFTQFQLNYGYISDNESKFVSYISKLITSPNHKST